MNKCVLLFVFSWLFLQHSNAQEMGIKEYNADTLVIAFGGYFEYDVVFIHLNGVEVSRDLVYTRPETESSYLIKKFLLFEQTELNVTAILYRRHRSFNLEYNPLWWQWEAEEDQSIYEAPVVIKQKLFVTKGTNKYLLSCKRPAGSIKMIFHLSPYE